MSFVLISVCVGSSHADTTGVLTASGSPLRSKMIPRLAGNVSARSERASPCPCKKRAFGDVQIHHAHAKTDGKHDEHRDEPSDAAKRLMALPVRRFRESASSTVVRDLIDVLI